MSFSFVIMGAGNIASKFVDAVARIPDCGVCAVASKSAERAGIFAAGHGIAHSYSSYEKMLEDEKPDCAYIAVTTNDHYRLTMMCLERKIPVLCEKAMFENSKEAGFAFELSRKLGVFVMEGLWSRFLPAVCKVKQWVADGKIGIPEISQFSIGFCAPEDQENRYYSPKLGGGAAKDITVYAYELSTYILDQKIKKMSVSATWSSTGVDVTNHISIDFEHTLADIAASFAASMEDKMVIYGKEGKIVLPNPHYASECFLYGKDDALIECFKDKETQNGFIYEIEEAMRCVKEGKVESSVVPHQITMDCARLFDRIADTRGEGETKN